MTLTNTLAYYNTELTTAVNSGAESYKVLTSDRLNSCLIIFNYYENYDRDKYSSLLQNGINRTTKCFNYVGFILA